MADVQLTCTRCFTVTKVSEFVDDSALVCRSCGAKLIRPEREDARARKPRVAAERPAVETCGEAGYKEGNPAEMWPGGRNAPKPTKKTRVMHHWYALAIFVVFGGLMGYLRYGGGLDGARLDVLHTYAAPGVLVLHLLIILKAFEDQVFQGILCVLVPFYSFYYLFVLCDSVYIRALVGGLLVGIGQDAAEVTQVEFFRVCEFVRAWISRGG